MTSLADFLRRPIASTDAWNCSTEPADWCVSLGHPDFAAAWRGTLEPMLCDQRAADAGGLVMLWRQGIGNELRTTDDPDAGDIGVIAIGEHEAGAIFTGERWAVRGGRARHFFAPSQVRVIQAWRP